jgi:hypothetical protein
MASNDQSQYFNQQAAALAAQVAAQAAQLEFQRMRFEQLELPQFQTMSALDKEKLAFQKATEVWNQAFQEASVTGSYGGVPAAQYLLSASQQTGTFYQPGQLNATQQAQYQTLQQQVSTAQQQLMSLAPGTPEYTTASAALAAARAQLAPLQQILQGTNNAPVQTLAGQNQQFQQGLAIAQLTGIVPNSLAPWTPPAAPVASGAAGTGAGGLPTPTAGEMPPEGMSIADWLKARQGGQAGQWTWSPSLGNYAFAPGADGPIIGPAATTPGAPGTPAPPGGPEPTPGTPGTPAGGAAGGTPTMAYLQMLASLTGMYNGEPTPEYQQMLAALTGQFNGQPTQAAMEFAKQFGLSEAAVTGMYNGQPTQAAQEFAQQFGLSQAAVTGMYQGSPTQAAKEFEARLALDTQHEQNSQANQMLQLAASLRGPRNAFQFAKVLGGTPQGLSDVLAAVSGRYNLPGYQGGGAAPEAVNVNNFMSDVYAATPAGKQSAWASGAGPQNQYWSPADVAMAAQPAPTSLEGAPTYAPQMNQWSSPAPSYTVNPPGAPAPTNAYNYQPTGDGSQTVYPPGISAPVQAGQVSSPAPLSGANLQQIGAQQMAAQPYQLPRPSQWNAEAYANLGAYRQDLLGAQYEAAGWDPQAAIDQFKQSLPTYGGPKTAKIAGIA